MSASFLDEISVIQGNTEDQFMVRIHKLIQNPHEGLMQCKDQQLELKMGGLILQALERRQVEVSLEIRRLIGATMDNHDPSPTFQIHFSSQTSCLLFEGKATSLQLLNRYI